MSTSNARMRVILIAMAIVVVVIVGIIGSYKKSGNRVENSAELRDPDKPTVKIGIIYPLSGDVGHMGQAAKIGINMFEEELKKLYTKYNYQISIEDNQLQAPRSVMIAKKMIEVDKVDVIITIGSNIGNAISPLTQRAKVLHFSISSDENVSTGEYNFLAATPNNKMIEKFISELEKHNLKNIALVTQNQAAMLAYDREFMATDKDIKVLSHNYINPGDRDYRLLIYKILADKPDAVVPLVYIPEITIFVKQLKDAKPDVIVANLESLSYPEDKSLFNGYWFIDGAVPNAQFIDKFKSIKGDDGYDYMPYMYASLEVLRDSLEKIGNNKDEVIKYILDNQFETVLNTITFDKSGIMQTPASVRMIKDGVPVVLE